MLELKDNDTTKILGLVWNPRGDQLLFKVSPHAKGQLFTKRTLLADLNRVFDLLGFLVPILISGKIFFSNYGNYSLIGTLFFQLTCLNAGIITQINFVRLTSSR
ncbi:unnamed protein product [Macrosiphum euphorbiae]|uniref:Uncharacterized protein n=1 Tax=Macrosiphum euphorbiae TaxID=13131 RepID=A0AAV0X7I3_9HEMI|nr:unnamed protein product [Macrosiphum euphorbiae]